MTNNTVFHRVIPQFNGEIMGQHIITGKDGSTLELNFSYDNGLPTKPIINPTYSTGYAEKEKFHVLAMYLTEEDLKALNNLSITKFYVFEKEKQIWLVINEHYVVFDEITDKIITEAKCYKLVYLFYKENGDFIKGTQLE